MPMLSFYNIHREGKGSWHQWIRLALAGRQIFGHFLNGCRTKGEDLGFAIRALGLGSWVSGL